jgi:hypothetical protein
VRKRKWMIIAKNMYMTRTSGFRTIRWYLPFLIGAPILAAIFYLVPTMTEYFLDEIQAYFVSSVAVVFIEVILLATFILFVIFPVTFVLNTSQVEQYEIFLAAPVQAKDVLLGKFVGDMPFYSVGVASVASVFVALALPLGISLAQAAIMIIVFLVTFFSALWIGIVLAASIRTRLGASSRSRDFGKAIAMLIALPMVALIYAMMGGAVYNALLASEGEGILPFIIGLLPCSWGADIVVIFANNPGDITASFAEVLLRIGGMITFFVAFVWLGVLASERVYNLESQSFSAYMAKNEGRFYGTIRRLTGGGPFATLVVSVFKDYGRRMENLSKVAYIVGLALLITIFFDTDEDIVGGVIMLMFLLPMITGFVVGEVTVRGKENLFIYRKAPGGESQLVRARIAQSIIVITPIAVIAAMILVAGAEGLGAIEVLLIIGFVALLSIALIVFSLGLFLMNPVFSEKPADMMMNVMIGVFFMIGCFFASIFLGIVGELAGWLFILALSSAMGTVTLTLGLRNLKTME